MTGKRVPPEQEDIEQNDPDDEILTAYLDEELTDAEKADTEKRLAADPRLKKRLEKLRAAGQFLESLELVPPNRELTATTMELLTDVVQREIRASEKRRRQRNLILVPLIFLAACAAFFLISRHSFHPSQEITEQNDKDFPVYSHLWALKAVQTVTLLRQLSELPCFSGNTHTFPASGVNSGRNPGGPNYNPENQFRRPDPYIQRGPAHHYQQRLREEFTALSENEQEKYRNLWFEINNAPDRNKLIRTLRIFGFWFQRLPKSEQTQFYEKPESERAEFAEFLCEEIGGPIPPFGGPHSINREVAALPPPSEIFGRGERGPFNLEMLLPKEVRGETLDIQDDFDAYIESLWKESSPQELFNEKPKRVILDNFIDEKGIDYFTAKLSDDGKAYVDALQDQQKHFLIAVLIQTSLCDEIDFDSDPQEKPDFRPPPGDMPPPEDMIPPGPSGGRVGSFWKRESTAALAETLRRLPEETRNELLSLPADEMYSQLLLLHWGFDPRHGPSVPGLFGERSPVTEPGEKPEEPEIHHTKNEDKKNTQDERQE